MKNKIFWFIGLLLLPACSQYGGGTTGTGLNFRENAVGSSATSSCGAELSAPSVETPTTISGKVVDEKGRALKGVEVTFDTVSDSQSTILDAQGAFQVVLKASNSGLLTVSVSSRGDKCTVDYPLSNVTAGALTLRLRVMKDGTLTVIEK